MDLSSSHLGHAVGTLTSKGVTSRDLRNRPLLTGALSGYRP